MPENELINRYLAGQSSDCLPILYQRYRSKIFRKCVAMVKDRELAQDCTQEVFLRAFLSLAQFRHRARFGTWLYSITHYYCLDQIKRIQAQGWVELTIDMVDSLSDERVEEEESTIEYGPILASLPEPWARLLEQKYVDGRTLEELALDNQTSQSAIKMRLFRARQAFRQQATGEAIVVRGHPISSRN